MRCCIAGCGDPPTEQVLDVHEHPWDVCVPHGNRLVSTPAKGDAPGYRWADGTRTPRMAEERLI